MNEYAVKKALAKRGGQQNNNNSAAQSVNGIPNSVLTDVFAGKRRATNEMMGHREELAPSIAAKMSQSFGMDFSAVKVYRSDAMAGTEMHGMAQGDKVVLSSDVDLNTQAGQAVLGHELSHIRAQSMGMGSGRGLLNDASLEHQADSEGMLAARGMSVSGETMGMSMGLGMAGVEHLSPIGAGLGASAGAPMQANKDGYLDDPEKSKAGKAFLRMGMGIKKGVAGASSVLSAPFRLMGAIASMAAAPFTLMYQKYKKSVLDTKKEGETGKNFFKILGAIPLGLLSGVANLPGAVLGGFGHFGLRQGQKSYNLGEGAPTNGNDFDNKVKSGTRTGHFNFKKHVLNHAGDLGYHMAQLNFNDGSEETLVDRISNHWNMGSQSANEKGFTHNKFFNFLRNTGNRKQKGGLLSPINWLGKLFFGRNLTTKERMTGDGTGDAVKRAEEETAAMKLAELVNPEDVQLY